jgi:hypothetical protein
VKIRLAQILPVGLACGFLVDVSGCGTNETLNSKPYGDAGKILGTGGRSGDGAVRGSGGSSGASSTTSLGKKCLKDSECKAPFTCITEASNDFGNGGPAGGLCTTSCQADSDCNAVAQNSVCVQVDSASGTQVCLQSCTQGIASATKCQGRSDMICGSLVDQTGQASGTAACQPACGGDFDCPGRKCDLRTGICTDAPLGTLPIGSPCDPNAATDPCDGVCFNFYDSQDAALAKYGSCTALCVLAPSGVGCGNNANALPPFNATCFGSSTDTPGDPGLCFELCNCDADCTNKAFVCRPFGDAASEQATGRKGSCRGPVDNMGAAVPHLPSCTTPPPGTGGRPGTGGSSGADAGKKPAPDARAGD